MIGARASMRGNGMPRASRKILDGYPMEFVFSSSDDLGKYFVGDKITCLLCGMEYRLLDTHLRHVHGMTSDDYREKYGIPYTRGLHGDGRAIDGRDRMIKFLDENPEIASKQKELIKVAHEKSKTANHRGKPTYWKIERTTNTRDMWEDVGRSVMAGTILSVACRGVGITDAGLLAAAKRRWPDFRRWWNTCVEPRRLNGQGINLTFEARAKARCDTNH